MLSAGLTLLLVLVATAASAALFFRRPRHRQRSAAARPCAPHEWHRVRRTPAGLAGAARRAAFVEGGGALLFAGLGVAAPEALHAWVLGAAAVLCALAAAWHAGLLPEALADCLACAREIRCFDPRGEVHFPREETTAELRSARGVAPIVLVLTRRDGLRRRVRLDEAGVRTLRALGWLQPAPSPDASPLAPADRHGAPDAARSARAD